MDKITITKWDVYYDREDLWRRLTKGKVDSEYVVVKIEEIEGGIWGEFD